MGRPALFVMCRDHDDLRRGQLIYLCHPRLAPAMENAEALGLRLGTHGLILLDGGKGR